ncbi:uncharacterized protein TNCV_4753561 [Trichonephila clavipes]|nr:uncharacterized protein TNCV_4753561 [Trichonephila clavipes]
MTEDDKSTGPAFKKVFGEGVKHLLCKWHLHRAWKKQLNNLVSGFEIRNETYASLVVLLEEKNLTKFKQMMGNFRVGFIDKEPAFIKYFVDYYYNRTDLWNSALVSIDLRPLITSSEVFAMLRKLLDNCDENKTVVNTSLKSVPIGHDVNLRITQAFSHIGEGYSAIEKFCMVMNIDPFSSTTYGKCARGLDNAYTLASENIFAEIHREIKNAYENGAEIADLSVSFDGTWLTRGHTPHLSV